MEVELYLGEKIIQITERKEDTFLALTNLGYILEVTYKNSYYSFKRVSLVEEENVKEGNI